MRKRNLCLPWVNRKSLHHALAKWRPFSSPRPCHTWLFGLTALVTCRTTCASKRSQPRAVLMRPTTSPVLFTTVISFCHPYMGWFLSITKHLAQGIPTSSGHRAGKNVVTTANALQLLQFYKDLQHVALAGLWVRSSASWTAKDSFWPHGFIMVSCQRRYEYLALQVQKAKRDALTQNLLSFKWTNLSILEVNGSFGKGFT